MHFLRIYRQMIRAGLLALLCVAGAVRGSAKVEIIDGNNGLSNSIVTAIIKDQRGLMWIGTRNGLNLYDGYTFTKPFRELANLPVTQLVYDDQRNIVWVGTDKGLYVVLVSYSAVRYLDAATEWGRHGVSAILAMPGRGVYAAYKNGVLAAFDEDYSRHIVLRLSPKDEYHPVYIRNMVAQTDSTLILLTYEDKELYRLSVRSGRMDTVRISGRKIFPIFIKRSGNLMFAGSTAHGLQLVDRRTFADVTPAVIRRLNARENGGMEAMLYGDICYAIYGYSNHYLVHLKEGTVTKVMTGTIHNGWRYNNCMFRDEHGIIWIGTERGIVKITEERKLFERILYDDENRSSIRAIVEDEAGDLYVGSHSGLYHYSKKSREWDRYAFTFRGPDNKKRLLSPFALMNDTNGYIYIAAEFLPFYRFNKQKKTIETDFYTADPGKSPARGFALYRDAGGLIWLGSSSGLLTFDPVRHTLVHYQKGRFHIGNCIVRQIQGGQDSNILWIATDKGLFQLHRGRGIIAHYEAGAVPDLSNNDIYCVEEDTLGQLWLGTNGGGINIISRDRETVRYLDKGHNGLANDIVYGMLRDKGRLWISTFNGLSCYDQQQETFTNYYTTDGLSDNDFNWNSFFRDRDGKMYFGGGNGINAFYPDSLVQMGNAPPRLFVSPVSRWSSETRTFTTINDFRGDGDRITLNSPNASLVFNLGLTDYTAPAYNSFSYRVQGLFDEWIPLSGSVLRLNGIPYGNYQVGIRATNARGVPAVNTLNFRLEVKLPFYKTWWFYTLMLLSAVALVFVFFLIKYRNLKNMQRLRLQIASDLHDEVGSVLTEITLFSDNLWISDSVGAEKNERLQKITTLSREATASMSDILWTIDVRNDFAGSMTDRMREHAEELLLPANIELHFDAGEVHHRQKMPAEMRQQLYLIFKEALSNIIRHAHATEVSITYRYDQGFFLLHIVNDGAGSMDTGGTGQGLRNMKMRAGRIGAHMACTCTGGRFSVTVEKQKSIS